MNDIYLQILGRKASQAEVQKWYSQGMSSYAIQQQLMMSKEFRHTQLFHQESAKLHQDVLRLFGAGLQVKPKVMQSWIAHGYTSEDVEAWLHRHPGIFRQSNVYKDRYSALADVYSQTLGVDFAAQDMRFQRQPAGGGAGQPSGPGRGDRQGMIPGGPPQGIAHATNKKQPQGPVTVPTHLATWMDRMAFQYKDPEAFKLALMKTPEYRALVLNRTGMETPQGGPTDQQGRPVTLNRPATDIAA